MSLKLTSLAALTLLLVGACGPTSAATVTDLATPVASNIEWVHLSSADGDLPVPGKSTQQTASLILDIDGNGVNDFVVGARQKAPSLVWYRRSPLGWDRYVIDDTFLRIEAGGAYYDIDGDGDLDIVMGADSGGNEVWWWENPCPEFDPEIPWQRRLIKNDGGKQHHDQIFGDFDGDGKTELIFWNQRADAIMIADIPDDPRNAGTWPYTPIITNLRGEGFDTIDMDGDGQTDLVSAGRWFKHVEGTTFTPYIIDDSLTLGRIAAGELIEGGNPEVVMVLGDGVGRLKWYACDGDPTESDCWIGHDMLGFDVDHGHSLRIMDVNGDGHLDIFVAEMRLNGENDDAKMWLFEGDGTGNFKEEVIATGVGNHESRLADLDGDGDIDILGKPYNWDAPRVDVWLNGGNIATTSDLGLLDSWQRHVIDEKKPWRAVFIDAGDINGDGLPDIVTGGWWYENPGGPDAEWTRHDIGEPLRNMAALYDFDGDGNLDVLGTEGTGSESNPYFVWARNEHDGTFTVLGNIEPGGGDFLQGVAFLPVTNPPLIALSWHETNTGVQALTIADDPADEVWPSGSTWTMSTLSPTSQKEALSTADIDNDGDPDLLLGTIWLENDDGDWKTHTLHDDSESPDRNRLADINGDGLVDAVVGYEAISSIGKLAWYEQGDNVKGQWTEHIVSDEIVGPMSLDVQDMDGDGDLDIVAGEHNLDDPNSASLYVFENVDSVGGLWRTHLVYTGDEHHDGARVVDIDNDGDLDIISIGWGHGRVLLYENTITDAPDTSTPAAVSATDVPTTIPTEAPATSADSPTDVPQTATEGGLQVLYEFDEPDMSIIHDVSGTGEPLDLTIDDTAKVQWVDGGLVITEPVIIASENPASKIIEAVQATNEITVEVWLKPENITQDGPARIISLSSDANHRNVTLGQGLWNDQPSDVFDVRLRTTSTNENGQPSLTTLTATASTNLTYIVYTRDSTGRATIYANDTEVAVGILEGRLSGWDSTYHLVLANEFTGERPWLGVLYSVAIYNRTLSPEEVTTHYNQRE